MIELTLFITMPIFIACIASAFIWGREVGKDQGAILSAIAMTRVLSKVSPETRQEVGMVAMQDMEEKLRMMA